MKRVAVYLTELEIQGIVSKKELNKDYEYLSSNKGVHTIPSYLMSPDEEYNVIASESVKISTLTKDHDTKEFYDLGETLITDRIIKIEVRSFELSKVYSLKTKTEGFTSVVLVDLVF